MMSSKLKMAAAALAVGAIAALAPQAPAFAQAKEQFFPVLVYRTGAYAPNGVPFANGYVDYLKMVQARDGGIGGVKITYEECETGYATDKGVECYERLKGKGPTGATVFHPLSTGITFALTDKAPNDKIPIITAGYGRSESQEGRIFKWNFPIGGTYWGAADILTQHIGKKEGGLDKLKGKKLTLIYHDSPFGKEPIPLLQERAKMHGFDLQLIPVTHPGVEQKAAWLQVRQSRPDYVLLWGWGVMNSTALKEAVATGFPREKMFGVWWSAAEPDVTPVGDGAKGYSGLNFQAGQGVGKAHDDILKLVHGKGQGTGPKEEVGTVLYNRGLVAAAVSLEGVRRAQEKYGKKPLTGEQARWGYENLAIDDKRIAAMGLTGFFTPVSTSCADHMGANEARVHTWNGTKWNYTSETIKADMQVIKPLVDAFSKKYAAEKKIGVRDCATDAG
jgi:branched-chain amino acid transport system substrate-binding protein